MLPKTLYARMLSNTGIYAAGIIIGKLSSFLLLPLYTRYLTPADYGVLELVELSFFVATAVGMRFGEAFFYFYFRAGSPEAKARVLSTAFLGSAAIGVAASAVFCVLAGRISLLMFQTTQYEGYFRLMFAALAFCFLQDIGFCYFRALDRPATFVWVSTAKLGLTIVFNVLLLVWFRMGIAALLWSSVLVSAATAVSLGIWCLWNKRLAFDPGIFRNFACYGAPMAASGLGLLFIHYADRVFLQRYATLAEVGIYSLGYKIGQLAAYVWIAFGTYWNAQMFQIVARKNGDFVYSRVLTYFALTATWAAVALAAFARPMLQAMAAPAFSRAALFVAPVAAAYAIKGIDDYLRSAFLLESKTAASARVTWAGVAICLLGYLFLVPRYKSWGAVVATFGTFAAMTVLTWFTAQRVRRFPFEYGRLCRLAACAGVCFTGAALVEPGHFAAQLVCGCGVVAGLPLLLWVSGFLEDRETALCRAALARLWAVPRAKTYGTAD